ncbi:MAG: aminoglycoside phosphotransferase family protein [Deltaproteobacteria bacterium]
MRFPEDPAAVAVLEAYHVPPSALLGSGGEASVYALDGERVLRVHRPGPTEATLARRASLLAELAANDPALPFAIPEVLEQAQVHERWVTIERRLPGRPFPELLTELEGAGRDSLVLSYLEAGRRLARIPLQRAFYGDLLADDAIQTASFRQYLEQRAQRSLALSGEPLAQIDAGPLASALPEATEPAFVYLDFHPANVLVGDGRVTAVVDFGGAAIVGEQRFGAVVPATALPPRDEPLARAWLHRQGWSELYAPTRDWMAAFWSFARDDEPLFAWCRSVLLR